MTVGAKQDAFAHFISNFLAAAVGQRAQVEVEALVGLVYVVPPQRGEVSGVPAPGTRTPLFGDELALACETARLLGHVALMAAIRVAVLASQ